MARARHLENPKTEETTNLSESSSNIPAFKDDQALLPAIAQDAKSGEVLMLGYMNAEAYAETMKTGYAVYYSRSRQRLWKKGESSGHLQKVIQVMVDCDADTILMQVEQTGVACHEGYRTCFFRAVTTSGTEVIAERAKTPDEIYGEKKK